MSNCVICDVELKTMTKAILGTGKLSDGEQICSSCFTTISQKHDIPNVKKFDSREIQLISIGEKSPKKILKERLKTESLTDKQELDSTHCVTCRDEIKFMNKATFGSGDLNDGNRICSECYDKIEEKYDIENVKKFNSSEIKLIFLGEKSPKIIIKERLKAEILLESLSVQTKEDEPVIADDNSAIKKKSVDPKDSKNKEEVITKSKDKPKSSKDTMQILGGLGLFIVSMFLIFGGSSSPDEKLIGNWSANWEGYILNQYNSGSGQMSIESDGSAYLSLTGSYGSVTHRGIVKGKKFIITSGSGGDKKCSIIKTQSGYKVVLIWTGMNVDVFISK